MELFAPTTKDAYKIGHINQYPKGTEKIYSNLTARSGRKSNIEDNKGIIFVGLQYVILDTLINSWGETFFKIGKETAVNRYSRLVNSVLGYEVNVEHMKKLHELGYLPVEIRAIKEGTFVPYKVPMMTIMNTMDEFYWVTNMLETVISSELWGITTSSTTYNAYRSIFHKYALETGGDLEFIPFQGHDFSFRGSFGKHAGAMSAFGALAAGSKGTDTLSGIQLAEEYYNANIDKELVGVSVNATEHSVMCTGGKETEIETFKRLLNEIYPTGILSVVSDTWDLWGVVEHILPKLKEDILNREGKLVIRPDSGDPVKIITGDPQSNEGELVRKGLIQSLWDIFGGTVNDKGFKVLNAKIGAIYGDAITLKRQEEILNNLALNGFCSTNIILGIGSYSYQYVTRDTHGMAMKATAAKINGEIVEIFKDPKTDNGVKKSAKGFLKVIKSDNSLELIDQVSYKESLEGELELVFKDGIVIKEYSLNDIREQVSKLYENIS